MASSEGGTPSFSPQDDLMVAPSIFWAFGLVAGTLLCFWGYRFVKPSVSLMAFVVGGLLSAQIMERLSNHNEAAMLISLFVGGLAIAFVMWQAYELGVFMSGVWGGYLLSTIIYGSVLVYLKNDTARVIVYYLIVILCSAACGFVALKIERPVLIVVTAFVGAHVAVRSAGYFIGNYPSSGAVDRLINQSISEDKTIEVPMPWIWYLIATVAMAITGIVVQFAITAARIHHPANRYDLGVGRYERIPETTPLHVVPNGANYGAPAGGVSFVVPQYAAPQAKGDPVRLA